MQVASSNRTEQQTVQTAVIEAGSHIYTTAEFTPRIGVEPEENKRLQLFSANWKKKLLIIILSPF